MITHGNKQISEIVYARKASEGGGAVRLTNIIRGAQVVFGGLKPDVKGWLEKATKAAILAAFGQDDGYAVIKATNAYLNALAETDKTKASALAGFINEDPMLVCSLELQPQGMQNTMKERYLYGKGRIDFTFGLTQDDILEIKTTRITPSGSWGAVASLTTDNQLVLGWRQGSGRALSYMRSMQYGNHFSDLADTEEFIQRSSNTYDNVKTSAGRTSNKTINATGRFVGTFIFDNKFYHKTKYLTIEDSRGLKHWIVPFSSTEHGTTLLDLVTFEFGTVESMANYTAGIENKTSF